MATKTSCREFSKMKFIPIQIQRFDVFGLNLAFNAVVSDSLLDSVKLGFTGLAISATGTISLDALRQALIERFSNRDY